MASNTTLKGLDGLTVAEQKVASRLAKLGQIAMHASVMRFNVKEWSEQGLQESETAMTSVTSAEQLFLALARVDSKLTELLRGGEQ